MRRLAYKIKLRIAIQRFCAIGLKHLRIRLVLNLWHVNCELWQIDMRPKFQILEKDKRI
jgi:hypothetical protein